jgi:hypothetical protein
MQSGNDGREFGHTPELSWTSRGVDVEHIVSRNALGEYGGSMDVVIARMLWVDMISRPTTSRGYLDT